MRYAVWVLFASAAFGQQYEIGADVGYGIYRDGTIFAGSETVQAGIRNRFAAGIVLGDEFSNYVSAEIQYLYHDGHPFLEGAGVKSDIQGNSQALTYSLLVHFQKRERRWRLFVEGGVGAKGYIIAGPAPFPQPIPQVASLTTNDVWKVVFSPGGLRKCSPRGAHRLRYDLLCPPALKRAAHSARREAADNLRSRPEPRPCPLPASRSIPRSHPPENSRPRTFSLRPGKRWDGRSGVNRISIQTMDSEDVKRKCRSPRGRPRDR